MDLVRPSTCAPTIEIEHWNTSDTYMGARPTSGRSSSRPRPRSSVTSVAHTVIHIRDRALLSINTPVRNYIWYEAPRPQRQDVACVHPCTAQPRLPTAARVCVPAATAHHPCAPSKDVHEEKHGAQADDAADDDRISAPAGLDHGEQAVDAGHRAWAAIERVTDVALPAAGVMEGRHEGGGERLGQLRRVLRVPGRDSLSTPCIRELIPDIVVRCRPNSARVSYAWLCTQFLG